MKTTSYLKELFTMMMASLAVFVNPILPFFLFTGFLVTLDWFVAYKVNNFLYKETFNSEKSKGVLVKLLIYSCSIIAARFMDIYVLGVGELGLAVKGTMVYLMIAELRSLDEKYYKMKGVYIIKSITDFLNKVANKFKKNED
jgi:hypothetical protein